MDEELIESIRTRTTERLLLKVKAGQVDDSEFMAAFSRLTGPWIRARCAEGHDVERMRAIAEADEIFARRFKALLGQHYPRLWRRELDAACNEVLAQRRAVVPSERE